MQATTAVESRNATFQQLKPVCIHINKLVLSFKKQHNAAGNDIVAATETLRSVLGGVELSSIDANLADYVFFPLSNILRESTRLPSRATELVLECVSDLLATGWNNLASAALCKQLLVLFDFVLSHGQRGTIGPGAAFSDQTKLAAAKCLNQMSRTVRRSLREYADPNGNDATAVIGSTINSLLETIQSCQTAETQLEAATALVSLTQCLQGREMLRTFLPGTISTLVTTIQPQAHKRVQYRVVAEAINALHVFLHVTVFERSESIMSQAQDNIQSSKKSDAWFSVHKMQLSLALSKVTKARNHGRPEVHHALFELCKEAVQNHTRLLPDALEVLLETLISLLRIDESTEGNSRIADIESVLCRHKELLIQLKGMVFTWISRLSSRAQSSDMEVFEELLKKISISYSLLMHVDEDITFIRTSLWTSICDCAQMLLPIRKDALVNSLEPETAQQSLVLAHPISGYAVDPGAVTSVLIAAGTRSALLQDIVDGIIKQQIDRAVINDLPELICGLGDDFALPGLWLASRVAIVKEKANLLYSHDLLWIEPGDEEEDLTVIDPVAYMKALDVLKSSTHINQEPAMQIVSLGIVAVQAHQQQRAFIPELVDVLFPVVERLGSSHIEVRNAAMRCLQVIAASAEVTSPKDLLVENVDYLLNAITLRLNTFDISVQTPRILRMMIELCGPGLLPYLDDLVEAIVSMLSSYHGYPTLVDSLFSVLDAIIVQANSSVKPTYMHADRSISNDPILVSQIPAIVSSMRTDRDEGVSEGTAVVGSLGMTEKNNDQPEKDGLGLDGNSSQAISMAKTIVALTQYHLNNESSQLRIRLLRLVELSCTILEVNEDEFLPILNDVWPLVIKRLYDKDVNTSIAAARTLGVMFQYAGDFLSSRVQDEWHSIIQLAQSVAPGTATPARQPRHKVKFTAESRAWKAILQMLVVLMRHISIVPEMEDELFILLTPYSEHNQDVHDALQRVNADALWLHRITTNSTDSFGIHTPLAHGSLLFKEVFPT